MSYKGLLAVAAVLLCWAAPAGAQPVKLRFHDGLVTLSTQNAPLRAILTEWARLGGATIVNAERVVGPPLTLELDAVSERHALEVLLRNVSGYMLAPRAAANPGASVFDRIMILPTSSAPRNPPPTAVRGFPAPRPVMPQPEPGYPMDSTLEQLEEDPPEDIAPPDYGEVPVLNPLIRRRPAPNDGFPPGPQPFEMDFPQPEPEFEQPFDEQPAPPPTNPFGIPAGATSRPGMIAPVPEQQDQQGQQPDPQP